MFIFNIKNIRLSKNVSLYKLSQLTGLSRTYIRKLENNKFFNPTFNSMLKIAIALNVNIKDLFYTSLDIEDLREKMYKLIYEKNINSRLS